MRTYTCKKCNFSFGEADKDWDALTSTNQCPNCSPPALKVKKAEVKKLRTILGLIIIAYSTLFFFNLIGAPIGRRLGVFRLIFDSLGAVGLGTFFLIIGAWVIYSGVKLK